MSDAKLKKSETLEVRIPYPTKLAFMSRCRDEGRSASEAVRDFIERELAPPTTRKRPRRPWRLAVGALIAAAVGAAAAPSLAGSALASDFSRLDVDRDGRITAADLRGRDLDGDGAVSLSELRRP
ncbi:MAG: hypothetical protein JNK30_20485 [Phenylobacterium sp.]|uniref:hypothetical protein n=1 Tax=Phenylobacterium sp. TaxID=1871053 RepID=UPI001A4CEB8B|nr:hypothetical protein [Phenylobacterium sp.]MBL8773775.1 hypothetical protein [Phenylobacterium sp.]